VRTSIDRRSCRDLLFWWPFCRSYSGNDQEESNDQEECSDEEQSKSLEAEGGGAQRYHDSAIAEALVVDSHYLDSVNTSWDTDLSWR
jgi:hypothetical protein